MLICPPAPGAQAFFHLLSAAFYLTACLAWFRMGKIYQAYKTVSPHQLLHIPGSDSWVWSQCQCQCLKTAGLPSPSSNHKPSSSLKQAPDGNGVRLWKNRVDRIQDPVKGLTLTRRILASGLLLPLHPILSLPPSLPFSLFSSLYLLLSPTCLFEHRSWQNCKASYLFIDSLWFPLAPQSCRGFSGARDT